MKPLNPRGALPSLALHCRNVKVSLVANVVLSLFLAAAMLPLAAWLLLRADDAARFMGFLALLYFVLLYVLLRHIHLLVVQGTSQRGQLEAQLKMKSHVLDHSSEALYLIGEQWRFVYVNQQACRMLGYGREELLAMGVPDIDPDFSAPSQAERLKYMRLAGGIFVFETHHKRRDGTLIPVEIEVSDLEYNGQMLGLALVRDITERKHTQAALAAHAAEFRSLAENSPDAIFRYDREGRRLYVNHAVERITGKSRDELVGKSIVDAALNPYIDSLRARQCVVETAQTGERRDYETTFLAADGRLRTLHKVFVPEFSADGSVRSVLGIGRDISDRRRMEQALAEREAFLETLLDAIAIPVFYKDREGRYLGLNLAFEQYFGMKRADLVGKSVFDTQPAELAQVYHAKDMEVLERKVPRQEYESQVRHSNGTLRDVMFSKAAFTDAQGEVKGLIGAVMDITERKQSENKLREQFNQIVELNERLRETARQLEEQAVELEGSHEQLKETEAWYRSILQSAPDGMMVVDAHGRITLANQELERMFGYEAGELAGQTMEVLLPSDLRGAHVGMRQAYSDDAARTRVHGLNRNLRARCKDGSEFVVDVTLARLPENDGNGVAICAAVRDVTERRGAQLEVAETRNRLRNVLHTIPDLVWLKSVEGEYLACNPAFERFFGATEAEIVGKTDHDFVDADLADFFRCKDMEAIEAGTVRMNEEWVTYADSGTRGLLETRKVPVFNAEGQVTGVLGVARDITERKRLELELAKREHEFRTLVENATDTVARYARDMRRMYANPAFAQLVEGGAAALLGKKPSEVPGGAHAMLYEEMLAEVLKKGQEAEFELKWHDKSGREQCSLINLTPEFAKDGTVETVLAVGRDISELNIFRQKIHQMAFYDTLTALPNRALFNDRLRQMITDASWHHQLAGVMLLDMDRFKVVNDTMGHAVGDELLRETGRRLSACLRTYDTVARLGGDEFAMLLPDVRNAEDLGGIADKIRSVFEAPFLLDGKEVFISCSIGIALYPNDSAEADDLLRYADSAMYLAKRSGRNNFRFYSRDLTESANERLTLESDMRRATERGELELYYQPKVNLANRRMIGSEALLRWKHPVRGMITPDKFIPVAEDSGLIIEIGAWVLREACATACELNGPGKPPHKVAINLSARQFLSNDLVATVRDALRETGCQPQWIELEITESLLLDEGGDVLDMLKALRALGITIAIDDFGTGYSALSYLARFPINTLKIDRSFVSSIESDSFRAELVKAIISIAHCLGQQVVAEGVETPGQAAFLQAHACHFGQGYLFSKPIPKAAFVRMPGSIGVMEPDAATHFANAAPYP